MSLASDLNKMRRKRIAETGSSAGSSIISGGESPRLLYSSHDIAPVRETTQTAPVATPSKTTSKTKDDDRKWFEKGFFEDGYQFGDLGKTLLSTSQDITENMYAGIVGMGEKIVDAGAYAVGGVAGLFGGDGVKDKMQEFIAKDLYDEKEVAKWIVDHSSPTGLVDRYSSVDMYDTDEGSFLGEKSEGLVQSAGQLAATVALQSVGVPWYLTSGVTSFGGEVESAFNQGATYGQAGVSAAITAGAELLTEKLFKGSGLGEKGLFDTSKITANITNRILKTFADFGVDMASEGVEEIASGWLSALGQNLTYADDKTMSELFSSEDAFESFVGGALLSGGMNAGKTVKSVKTGRDYNTGFTANEEKVVKKEVENRIAEAEKGGKKLTDKQKAEIRDSVETALKRGEISTDTIESIFGGEDYKAYKDAVDSENALAEKQKALQAEFDTLNKMKQGEMTGEQVDRREELRGQLADIKTQIAQTKENSQVGALKQTLSKNVQGQLVKGKNGVKSDNYLLESYNEVERSKHAFEVDLSDKKGLEKENLQAIMDKKLINNTRRTHDFWELAAKATAERGQKLTVTTTEEIIEMEVQKRVDSGMSEADARKAVDEQFDGVIPNGYKLEDGTIALNVKSGGLDARRFILGHEIGHDLETHGEYDTLKELLKEYDKTKTSKEAHAKRKTDTEDRYKNVKDANADNELTNDLIGQYIYGDEDFVRHLSVKNPNIFKRIWNKVKYLYKMATAGSQEKRDLLRIQNVFEKVYRESAQNKTEGKKGKTDFSLDKTIDKNWENGYNLYTTTDDFIRQVPREKRHDFARSLANKTSGMTDGETRTIYVNGYIFEADGYMHGSILAPYNEKSKKLLKGRKQKYGRINEDTEIASVWSETVRDAERGSGGDIGASGRGRSSADDRLLGESPERHTSGDNERVRQTLETEEEIDEIIRRLRELYGLDAKKTSETLADTQTNEIAPIKASSEDGVFFDGEKRQFSLSEAVEETPDLIAAHNLSSDNLLKSLKLGGLPMPSVAITRADGVHNDYGDISVILRKSAIDPKANRDNKIYSGDAWTPVYPTIEYKPNDEITRKIGEKYYELERKYGYDDVRPLYRFANDTEDALKRDKGEQGLLNALYDDTSMMQVYLLDKGLGKVETIQDEIRTELSDVEVAQHEFFIKELGADVVDGVMFNGEGSLATHRKQYWENHGEQIKETYKKLLTEEYGFTEEEVQNVFNAMKTFDFLKLVRNAHLYRKNGRVTVKTEPNREATNKAIREKAADGYKEWVDGLFKGIEEKTGIRNNRDYFTPSGNRRSWDALHWENTLENVVRVMKEQGNGENTFFTGHGIWGAAANEYKSIEDVKADSDRLKRLPKEEYEAIRGDIGTRLQDVAQRIMDKSESNQFIAADNALACIVDAVRHSRTADGILKELKQYRQLTVTEADAKEVVSIVADIAKMPTEYFEAKPRRAVGFDEVGVFVIPRNADVKLKQELLNRGYAIAEYDPDVEGDRQKVVNSFEEYKFSLSDANAEPISFKDDVPMSDSLIRTDDVAPVKTVDNVVDNSVAEAAPVVDETVAPVAEMPSEPNSQDLYAEKEDLENRIREAMAANDQENAVPLIERYNELFREIKQMEADESERLNSLSDADMPPETEAPYYGESEAVSVDDPFESRDIDSVGNRKVKAYMFENPEVKPFFQEEAQRLLGELERTEKPQTIYLGDYKYNLPYDAAKDLPDLYRTSRQTTDDIAYLRDSLNMSYADIEKGIKAIIEDNGAENIAAAKKIEFILNDRLMNGYNAEGVQVPPDQGYLNLLNEKQITEYNDEARRKFFEVADEYAPPEDIAPVAEKYEAIKPKQSKEPSLTRETEDITPTFETKNADQLKGQQTMFDEGSEDGKTAEVLTEEPETEKKKSRGWSKFKTNFLDKGAVFEDLSLKTKNRELMGKWNHTLSSESRAQWLIGKGTDGVKSLNEIRAKVEDTGLTKDFYEYLYHKHNVDRMSIEGKAEAKLNNLQGKFDGLKLEQIKAIAAKEITDKTTERTAQWTRDAKEYLNALEAKNKPVFGDSVTAEVSQEAVNEYEKKHPEFKALAQDVYDYTNHLRSLMVENGVISQETADLWAEMYPNYVPVRRAGHEGAAVTVPLDTGRTGVNAPIKRATGGNSDILPLFDTLALRTEQTFKAIARNSFGVELKNTLGTTVESNTANLDEIIDSIDTHEELLKKGEKGKNPTFTVFEDGKRVEFEITEDMYDALKPTSDGLKYKNKVLGTATKIQRGLLTEYNPVFMATNAIKDVQDILVNSQHAAKTYANLPSAIKEMVTKGKWYQEYMENGGEQNTYFDSENKTFTKDDTGIKKLIGIPLRGISAANNFIERLPRLAEYIASRKSGASVEVAMLDAARVTTNFAAGGDVTKFLDRNGATFLNASVQGFNQQVRNIREAKANGLKGWAQLAAKFAVAGLPAVLLNHLMWDDDEEYEELSDYVKDNYYVVAKMDDGTFVRIPKGRALAVIQNAMEQISNAATGDDEVDLESFLELAISNLAPNNPIDSNILAPIMQVANNETWYGEDLVPTRLQDLPDAEQYDESTDSISKWLGEKLDYSPYKINYLLNQYSGGVGDVFLPMLTPEAESGDNSFGGNIIAPFKDKFTTNSVMNNQNISDFYDTVDELAKNANSMYATDADALSYKYMNSISSDIGELYQKKREIQNSYLSDAEKYEAVREIQDQINALARESLATYGNVNIDGGYATVGDLHYRWYEPSEDSDAEAGWQKITDKQLEKQEKVTGKLGISASEYWSNKEEYDYAYDYPEKYAVAKSVGGYKAFRTYASELYDIKADKDEDGKSISGSRKEKVIDYVNSLDIDYGMRIILFKSEYNADDTYNYDILDYLNSRNDISYEEMATILKELGFTVHSNGRVTW